MHPWTNRFTFNFINIQKKKNLGQEAKKREGRDLTQDSNDKKKVNFEFEGDLWIKLSCMGG